MTGPQGVVFIYLIVAMCFDCEAWVKQEPYTNLDLLTRKTRKFGLLFRVLAGGIATLIMAFG